MAGPGAERPVSAAPHGPARPYDPIVTVPLLTAATDSFRPFALGTGVPNVHVTANGEEPPDAPQSVQAACVGVPAVRATATSEAALSRSNVTVAIVKPSPLKVWFVGEATVWPLTVAAPAPAE